MTFPRPRCNAKRTRHSSHCTLHTPALHTSNLHFTLHTSSDLKSCGLFSPHLSSSHLITSLLTCHPSNSVLLNSSQLCTPESFTVRDKSLGQKKAFAHRSFRHRGIYTEKPLQNTLSYKACTKHVPVLLRTTKLAQSMCQYYFVLQSLHKACASTTSYYKACTK